MSKTFDYTAPADLLKNRIILVTGAAAGIGQAAALAYGQHGAEVVLSGRSTDSLEQTYDQMLAAGCPEPTMYPFDLSCQDEAHYLEFANAIGQAYGRLDGLLHNASVLGERKPVEQLSYSIWRELMQVNVDATFLLSKAMLPLLREAPSASMIMTSSSVGRIGRAYWGAYAVSKFAVEGLMQVLADEMENTSSIRVNSINPGATNTGMRQAAYPAEDPLSNPYPADIMPAYLYLMGDDSKDVNGQALDAQIKQ